MATLYITEYAEALHSDGETIPIGKEPAVAYQTVSIAGASAQSSAFNAKTKFIRVHTDAICSIKISSNPTAVTTESRMADESTEYFGVNPGDKIAVISNT